MGITAGAWDRITLPVLLMTGTLDDNFERDWTWRLEPFEALASASARGSRTAPTYLAIFEDATHMAFGDVGRGLLERLSKRDPRHHPWIQDLASDFFAAHLLGDRDALARLAPEVVRGRTEGAVELRRAE